MTPRQTFTYLCALSLAFSAPQALAWGGKAKPGVAVPTQTVDNSWRAPSAQERAAALRAEPIVKATFFARMFDHNPGDFESGLILSDTLRQLGRYDEAADVAHRILLFAPNNYEALLAASRAHIASNSAFNAVDLLQQASNLKPQDWKPWSLLGVAYDQIDRGDESKKAFETALRLSPDNPAVLTNIAMSLTARGKFSEAEPLLRKAVAQKDATKQMRQNLALVLGLEGKYTEAESWLKLDLPPEAVQQNLAWLRSQNADAGSTPTQGRSWESLRGGS